MSGESGGDQVREFFGQLKSCFDATVTQAVENYFTSEFNASVETIEVSCEQAEKVIDQMFKIATEQELAAAGLPLNSR